MTIMPESLLTVAKPSRWLTALARGAVSAVGITADVTVIVGMSGLAGAIYHAMVYESLGPLLSYLEVGLVAASIFVLPSAIRGEYASSNFFSFKPHARRVFTLWNVTFLCLLTLGFLTKMTEIYSRGTMILFYAAGLPAIMLARYALVRAVLVGTKVGLVSAQRVFLLGTEADVAAFRRRYEPWNFGLHVVSAATLTAFPANTPPSARRRTLEADVAAAVEMARRVGPDAVFIIVPWSDAHTIDLCVDEFLTIPVEIHLGPERILDRFENLEISKLGPMASLQLTRAPLSSFEVLQKRAFDVVVSTTALILLLPLLTCIAILIRLDSPGPALFRQRRYGFNQEPFRIFKFRTMTTFEDEESIAQATQDDHRFTRLGFWLRRWNIDELPQLLNVLKGEMSLVGPRPHALCHDRAYERKISLYARRHNVRPGITGWAQVHGLRGETDTDEKMRRRIECDLYYIDNWSLWLDVRILFLTVFSPSAYRNAV